MIILVSMSMWTENTKIDLPPSLLGRVVKHLLEANYAMHFDRLFRDGYDSNQDKAVFSQLFRSDFALREDYLMSLSDFLDKGYYSLSDADRGQFL